MKTAHFFDTHPVFSVDEATEALSPTGGRKGALERLKYHLAAGRLKPVTRGIYAVVPPGASAEGFQPDPFQVAATVRPDGVFGYHSALELLGAAHSVWHRHVLFTDQRRRPLRVNATEICFAAHPAPVRTMPCREMGLRRVEYRGRLLRVTGPERTLVDGFRRPAEVGGLEELVLSAGGLAVFDLDLLEKILKCYDTAYLWAAAGWFMERFRHTFHVPDNFLERLAQRRPRSPQYLERSRRDGVLAARWHLLLPKVLVHAGEPDEH